ncbi:uncharacterized protein CC84DRAFT_1165904 [Paraphaeosphaeria sporulosa]|uniref:PXA domain-containing protein n=1 Tax=Paraphaeosphaeria sporulosa TaxID=1460663 RepID=A0A177CAC9_9PLEO|nr:uncharacterized protein CC84DRAFT_1165904 [Paraphaeosphaeria sporulosa]OAG03717.1 hypothetical protein CC84DRAFT_1165904 [Paraphaeosphaeria sporulosa]
MSDPIEPVPSLRDPLAPVPDTPDAAEESPPRADAAKAAANAPPVDWSALLDRALVFLSTASNETLGACLVGLGAGTYLVLGRVGLILIGVVGGVALHATWESHAHGDRGPETSHEVRRKELGVDIAHRVLSWREKRDKSSGDDDHDADLSVKLYSGQELDFSDFRPETAAALTELTDAIIRDYVKWWYNPIIPNETLFPNSSRQTLTAFLISMSTHLSRKRPADTFVDFVTKSSSFMIIFFSELANAILANPGDSATEAVDLYLKMKRDSTLATILDKDFQTKQLGGVAEDILQNYLEPKTYNCKPAREFLHQILAKVVLEMIVATCSKPEWINGWIVYALEDGEPELMEAIDAGVEASPLGNAKESAERREHNEEVRKHKRVVSRAQQAMDEAMQEAQRLNQMIAAEDARRLKEQQHMSSSSLTDDQSESTTQGVVTPTSSQSETLAENDMSAFGISNMPAQSSQSSDTPPPGQENAQPRKEAFTSFDQLVSNAPPTALMDNPPPAPPPLTLHNCKMTIFDDSMPGEKGMIKNKPTAEYLIQIEPSLDYYKGWMSAKKYADFETLHEVLRRIAPITGAMGFVEAHKDLPTWKNHTKASLRGELERYLNDAVQYRPLAESEGMKRFLDKEIGNGKSPGAGGIWPGQAFETMGKGMMNVLTQAPKDVAGGGKALFGGVTGVLGSVTTPFGAKNGKKRADSASRSPSVSRTSTSTSNAPISNRHGRAESTVSELPTHIRSESTMSFAAKRTSTESLRAASSPIIDQQPQREAPMERRPSYNPDGDGKRSGPSSLFGGSRSASRAASVRESMDLSPTMGGDQLMNLPPMPSEISDDYTDPVHSRHPSRASTTSIPIATDAPPVPPLPRRPSAISLTSSNLAPAVPTATAASSPERSKKKDKPKAAHAPLSEPETTVLIELFFATINELYTLSSAWSLRRTLLNAAKTFLLRPGNPQLTSIQTLMQSTVLDANTSDEGLAYHIRKIRANALPTEAESKDWEKECEKKGWVGGEMGEEEKERLRVKARKSLVERGMPQALTSVMGQAASGEALGRVFDALQDARVARGVIFGIMLQALKGVTQ